METWIDDKCGYCAHEEANLPKFVCPVCKRTGCPTCMFGGEAVPCPFCVEAAEQADAVNRLGS